MIVPMPNVMVWTSLLAAKNVKNTITIISGLRLNTARSFPKESPSGYSTKVKENVRQIISSSRSSASGAEVLGISAMIMISRSCKKCTFEHVLEYTIYYIFFLIKCSQFTKDTRVHTFHVTYLPDLSSPNFKICFDFDGILTTFITQPCKQSDVRSECTNIVRELEILFSFALFLCLFLRKSYMIGICSFVNTYMNTWVLLFPSILNYFTFKFIICGIFNMQIITDNI